MRTLPSGTSVRSCTESRGLMSSSSVHQLLGLGLRDLSRRRPACARRAPGARGLRIAGCPAVLLLGRRECLSQRQPRRRPVVAAWPPRAAACGRGRVARGRVRTHRCGGRRLRGQLAGAGAPGARRGLAGGGDGGGPVYKEALKALRYRGARRRSLHSGWLTLGCSKGRVNMDVSMSLGIAASLLSSVATLCIPRLRCPDIYCLTHHICRALLRGPRAQGPSIRVRSRWQSRARNQKKKTPRSNLLKSHGSGTRSDSHQFARKYPPLWVCSSGLVLQCLAVDPCAHLTTSQEAPYRWTASW